MAIQEKPRKRGSKTIHFLEKLRQLVFIEKNIGIHVTLLMVRICIRGNLPKCSEVKKPAEAASSIMWEVAFSNRITHELTCGERPHKIHEAHAVA